MAELNLAQLLSLIEAMPAYRRLLNELEQRKSGSRVVVLDAAKPYLVAALFRKLECPIVVVTAQPENCRKLYEQITIWSGTARIELLPESDVLPYQRIASDVTTEQERLRTLSALAGVSRDKGIPLVITSAPALMQKTVPYKAFVSACHTIEVGVRADLIGLVGRWESLGYSVENVVEVPGTVSRRGGIVDVYPPHGDFPARIEFLGDTVESIRLFDPASQRSLKAVSSIAICPATEILLSLENKKELAVVLDSLDLANCSDDVKKQFKHELAMLAEEGRPTNIQFYAPLFNTGSILDYLPADALLVLDDYWLIQQSVEALSTEYSQLRVTRVGNGELPSDFPVPYFVWQELASGMAERRCLMLNTWAGAEGEQGQMLDFSPAPNYTSQLPAFIEETRHLLHQKRRVVVVSHQASRLSELLGEEDIIASPTTEVRQVPPPGSLTLVQGTLDAGWVMAGDTCFFTDAELFGFVKQRRLIKRHPVPHYKLYVDIVPGDYVVHVEHGIGKFTGVTRIRTDNVEREYLVLDYAEGAKLYVPTDQIDRVSRYIGAGDQPPSLSRMGTVEWTHTKQRVKQAVEEVAHDLLQLYASREVVPGFAFSPDTVWQGELEASFPYVETPDQLRAAVEVKEDMLKPKPMDRLVCGDVGYGKTEIGIRAAFKAVLDNRQVAVLVPTTVLAQQHFSTFNQRLSTFPVKVEVLSRFRTSREQKEVLQGLANGTVDICIGTHRLLQKDVAFKDLGLLIIDEEQRFGVVHKEYLKRMRQEVDVLTLSATPIPRTLHMSLVGVRDMSIIQTPPEDRLPIKTYVAEYNEQLVREAILREMECNGQVFFIHNRVQSINYVADKLRALVPEAKVSVAHGRMPEEELEKVMVDFSAGNSDVLVCTTIIESGLDMPNVNTLIVNQADRFGLTQLYQLRGRIGRGANLAHAYFLYDRNKLLTTNAGKRLKTIYEATELGAGFGIAMKDLEIRGAGTLLGVKQSGHIGAVGFNLYTRLLAEAVEDQKDLLAGAPEKEKPSRLPPPSIDLPLPAFIPENYVADVDTRLMLYQSLVKLEKTEQLDDFAQMLHDRFGVLPDEVKNLLYAVRIKTLATRAGVESISTDEGQIAIRLFEGKEVNRGKLKPIMREGIRIGVNQVRLHYRKLGKEWRGVLEGVVGKMG